MHTSELGVLASKRTVDATFWGSKVTWVSNHIPAPIPRMKAPAMKALVALLRPPLLSSGEGGGEFGGRRGGGVDVGGGGAS